MEFICTLPSISLFSNLSQKIRIFKILQTFFLNLPYLYNTSTIHDLVYRNLEYHQKIVANIQHINFSIKPYILHALIFIRILDKTENFLHEENQNWNRPKLV